MGYMKSVDIVLTAHKLSDAQKNAVVELLSGGFYTAKGNTISSLVKRGLVEVDDRGVFSFEETFHADLREAYSQSEPREIEPSFHEKLMADVAEIEEELNTNMWDAPEITEEEIVDFKAMAETLTPERFNWELGEYSNTLMGYGDVYEWSNIRVWDGLTAEEIRADMDTARPVNRKARRESAKLQRKVLREMFKAA